MLVRLVFAAALAAAGALGCAGAPAHELRVQLKLAQASTDGTRIAREASDVAQVPVRYVAATTEQWHAVVLQCVDDAQCEQALQRLRADTAAYLSVDVDVRRRVHSQ